MYMNKVNLLNKNRKNLKKNRFKVKDIKQDHQVRILIGKQK
jgi:hypothetical protein